MASGNAGFHAGSLENRPAHQGLAGIHPNPQLASERKSPFDLNGGYDAEKANQHFSPLPTTSARNRPRSSRTVSWDIFSGLRNLDHSYDDLDAKNATDPPKVRSGLARPRTWLINVDKPSGLDIVHLVSKFLYRHEVVFLHRPPSWHTMDPWYTCLDKIPFSNGMYAI